MSPVEAKLLTLARPQDGAVTTAQALGAGLTYGQLRAAVKRGWTQPSRGVLVQPHPTDPFRASVRAALLVCTKAAVCARTGGRLHDLWGLPEWTSRELPELIVPQGTMRAQRAGCCLRFGLDPRECIRRKGFPVTNLARTVAQLVGELPLDDFVCLLDSALRRGLKPDDLALTGQQSRQLADALALSDSRSESALETKLRLLFTRAGLAPETLQLRLYTRDGVYYARVDMAWPSRRLVVEADGRQVHDQPAAVYGDRWRQNQLQINRWKVLRFTWRDVLLYPERILAEVREALARPLD